MVPENAIGNLMILTRGIRPDWKNRYEAERLFEIDPLPGIVSRRGGPTRLTELLSELPSLDANEQEFVDLFRSQSGLREGWLLPAFGPYGRPAIIGFVCPDDAAMDALDPVLASVIAQQTHIRMEFLALEKPPPHLSPREREILGWMVKGKSASVIATILSISEPTVTTHMKRIYNKFSVKDRIHCIRKAIALRFF